jgi:predicted CoA-substrate-specific enzyme activase
MKITEIVPENKQVFDTVVGIDIGSRAAKAVLLHKDEIFVHTIPTGLVMQQSAEKLLDNLLKQSGLKRADINYIVGTGYGRIAFSFEDIPGNIVSEISAHGQGVHFINPRAKTIIDIGGQDSKAIRINPRNGKVTGFLMNDKCAAGTGRFLEKVANILELEVDQIGERSLKADKKLEISSRCVVFAESEVISLRAKNESVENILAAVHMATAERVYTLLKRVVIEPEVVFSGGVSRNIGMRAAFEKLIGTKIEVPKLDLNYGGALGAAIYAQKYFDGSIEDENDAANDSELDLSEIKDSIQKYQTELIEVDDGTKKVGHICSYVPLEMLNAAGVKHARLMHAGNSDQVSAGEIYTSSTYCDFTKSLVGGFETGDPLMKAFDQLVFFDTCNPMRTTVDFINEKYVKAKSYLLPRNRTEENARKFFKNEIIELRKDLEALTGHEITDEEIRQQIVLLNQVRGKIRQISQLRKRNNPPIKGKEFLEIIKAYYSLPPVQQLKLYDDLYKKLNSLPDDENKKPIRIMLAGGIMAEGDSKVIDIIEDDLKARVVIDDHCTGYNPVHLDTKADGDVIQNIADAYLDSAPCARMVPLQERVKYSLALAKEYKVDAVIYKYIKFCQCYGMTANEYIKAFRAEGIPLLEISSDYSTGDSGQIRTRIEAFLEVVHEKKLQEKEGGDK